MTFPFAPAAPIMACAAQALPSPEPLEEVAGATPPDWACAVAFALARAMQAGDPRPLMFVAARAWMTEHGHPFGWGCRALGLDHARLILVAAAREADIPWAMEEALKSGAACAVLAPLSAPSFVATRRLDFAARQGRAQCLVLRARPLADLSAARLRWAITAAPSAPHPLDPRAPGAMRIRAELVRSRTGQGGVFTLEQDHETHGFRVAAGLADHGLPPRARDGRARAA
jgi:protein ImuA